MSRLILFVYFASFMTIMTTGCQSSKEQAIYLQNLTPYFWSSDESFIYATYANYKTVNEGDVNSQILKIDVNNGTYETIFKDEENHPIILEVDRLRDALVISLLNKHGLLYLKNTVANDLIDTQDAYIAQYAQYTEDHRYLLVKRQFDAYSEWGRYKISDGSFSRFKFSELSTQDIATLNINRNQIYLSNYKYLERLKADKNEQHWVGQVNAETAEILAVKKIPSYSDAPLRLRSWLSEDELLFSVMDAHHLEHQKSVSYRISDGSYHSRPDFQQDGILSPTQNRVAYLQHGVLMISNADGTGARIILDSRLLPKGSPRYLALL